MGKVNRQISPYPSYELTRKCLLCQTLIKDSSFQALVQNENDILLSEVAAYPGFKGIDIHASNGLPNAERVMISLRPPHVFRRYHRKGPPSFCIHDLCWKLAGHAASLETWYAMISSSQKGRNLSIPDTMLYHPDTLETAFQKFDSSTPSLDEILVSIRSLPIELRLRIWGYLDERSWLAKGLTAIYRSTEVEYVNDRHIDGPSRVRLGDVELHGYSCENLGVPYLSCIHVDSLTSCSSGQIEVPAEVSTIETASTCYGLSAVRFYTGDKKTEWLGRLHPMAENQWYRFIQNTNSSKMIQFNGKDEVENVAFDGIDKKDANNDHTDEFGHDSIWNPALPMGHIYPKDSYFSHDEWDKGYRYSTVSKFMRYVPFLKKDHRLYSITTFTFMSYRIEGLECVFQRIDDPSRFVVELIGKRNEFPCYLRLMEDEVISHVWIARETEEWAGLQEEFCSTQIGLIIGTSHGRVKPLNVTEYREVELLSRSQHGQISGIYYDSTSSFGVTYSGQPSNHAGIPDPDPRILGSLKAGTIQTLISMHEIEQIEAWHTDDRCMGLRVTFADGRQDALGRWDDHPADYS